MKRTVPILLLAVLAGCSDGPAGPATVRDLDILRDAVQVDEVTLAPGRTASLTASLKDGSGNALTGRKVTWRSTVPQVASVDTAGLVTALNVGTTLVIASADVAADTVRVNVVQPATGDVACADGDAGLQLAVGEVRTLPARGLDVLCVSGGTLGAEFTYIPFNGSTSTAFLNVEVTAGDVVSVIGPPNPSLGPTTVRAAGLDPAAEFHHRLRQYEEDVVRRLGASRELAPRYSLSTAAVPKVGDRLRLNVSTDACTNTDYRTARVEAVGSRVIIAADSLNPTGGFTRAEYEKFAAQFDTLVQPAVIQAIGSPSDLDQNQRVLVLFTEAVNDLTPQGSQSVVLGFFHPRDLYPKTGSNSCAGSNYAELLYLMVPDPDRGGAFAKDQVARVTLGTIAHELQHLINASRRIMAGVNTSEEVWLNEGLSHVVEELMFYAVTGLRPEMNLDGPQTRTQPVATPFVTYMANNAARYMSYLKSPEEQSLIGRSGDDDDLETRGAVWAFLRYAADRLSDPGAQDQIWFDLVNSSTSGARNLEEVFGTSLVPLMQDFTVAVYTDDAGIPVQSQFLQPSWNFRSLLPAWFTSTNGQFPLKTIQLINGAANQQTLRLSGGGAAFLRFGVAPGGRAALRATSGGVVPSDDRLRLSIVRTK